MSDAIRPAIVQQRDRVVGVSEERRQTRRRALEELIELSEGNDPAVEVERIKTEDEHG